MRHRTRRPNVSLVGAIAGFASEGENADLGAGASPQPDPDVLADAVDEFAHLVC